MGCITSKRNEIAPPKSRREWEEVAGKDDSDIPGSRFVRGYCPECGEPTRKQRVWKELLPGLTAEQMRTLGFVISPCGRFFLWNGGGLCNECNPYHKPPPGRYGPHKDDTSPGWENTVRALDEDR